MATWKNLDTLDSFGKLKELKNHVDIAAALSGEEGGKRVADYSTPMAAGLSYNYAAKEVDETVLSALAKLADEAQLIDKFQELYNGAVIMRQRRARHSGLLDRRQGRHTDRGWPEGIRCRVLRNDEPLQHACHQGRILEGAEPGQRRVHPGLPGG